MVEVVVVAAHVSLLNLNVVEVARVVTVRVELVSGSRFGVSADVPLYR